MPVLVTPVPQGGGRLRGAQAGHAHLGAVVAAVLPDICRGGGGGGGGGQGVPVARFAVVAWKETSNKIR